MNVHWNTPCKFDLIVILRVIYLREIFCEILTWMCRKYYKIFLTKYKLWQIYFILNYVLRYVFRIWRILY